MGMSKTVRLIDGADIVDYTGVQDLANLTADAELDLNDFALKATRGVFLWLKEKGIDPTLLTNEDDFKDAVAYEAVVRLARAGYLPSVDIAEMRLARDEALKIRPEFASGDAARTAGEGSPGSPVVGHVDDDGNYSDDFPTTFR